MVVERVKITDELLVIFKLSIHRRHLLNVLDVLFVTLQLLFHFSINFFQNFNVLRFIIDDSLLKLICFDLATHFLKLVQNYFG